MLEALLVTPDVHQPPGWSLQGVASLQWGPAAVFVHFNRHSVGFVQPGSRTRSFHTCPGQVSCRGGERTGNGVHCCTSHTYPTALLHHCSPEGLVPSPGPPGAVWKLFARCQLKTGKGREQPLLPPRGSSAVAGSWNFPADEAEEN